MYYSVCINAVFGGLPLHEALESIRGCGAPAFEFWSWEDADIAVLRDAQQKTGLRCAAMCARSIPLVDPARRKDYLDGLRASIAVAQRLDCPSLIVTVGQELPGVSREAQRDSIIDGLRAAAPLAEDAGVTLVVEPLNTRVDHKGYFLARSDEAFDILRAVDSPRVKLLFDIYHQQITEGNLIANLTASVGRIGHIHVAAVPGRHELTGENEIHYPSVFAALGRAGYAGAIGLEYFPLSDPERSLRQLFAQMPLNN